MKKFKKILCGGLVAAILSYIGLFLVFFFDLDGKFLYYVVGPFLIKHYDNMPRKDMTKSEYAMDAFPKYEYAQEEAR
ncbi:MAG: hypothetical protein GX684_06790 [Ruminococcaceae bacterium]|nr:hypothetical protein [Oscillospiraceae bacterium]